MMNDLYNVDSRQYPNPQDAFDAIQRNANSASVVFRLIATLGWANIADQIRQMKNELSYSGEGIILSGFAINYINNILNVKLPRMILELGTECIKHLTEKKIDQNFYMSETQKKAEKEWYSLFLDIWKEQMKEELERADLLRS